MICPIRFIRKPEESECIRDKCSFWVDGSLLPECSQEPKRFTALLGVNKMDDGKAEEDASGKCSILVMAEMALKAKPAE
jgi:hypothetical protein